MNKNDQEFLVQKIRSQYTEKESTELDALRELDAKVKRPANVFAYVFGSISTIIMGAGMSLVMTDIGTRVALQIPCCLVSSSALRVCLWQLLTTQFTKAFSAHDARNLQIKSSLSATKL